MNNALKYVGIAALALSALMPYKGSAETIVYKVTMSLKIPRVYDNMQSLGYRKIQSQKIVGYISVDKDMAAESQDAEEDVELTPGEPLITAHGFTNKTHKVGGRNVTYENCYAEDVMWRYIGSNKTGVFKKTLVKFSLDLDPSYNIGDDEPDNTLIIQLSGYGSSEKKIVGSVTGQLGCGCMAYGHVSPTRNVLCEVRDIAPVFGTFTMKQVAVCE